MSGGYLVIQRHEGERILLGDGIEIFVSHIKHKKVKLAIRAVGHLVHKRTKEEDLADRASWAARTGR